MVFNFNTHMKAFQTMKYLAFAGAATLWSCSSQQYAQKQNTEYDDLYFSSTDKKEVVYTASTSTNNNYSTGNTGVATQDNSQKNVNPEYIQQYADQGRSENEQAQTNGNDNYSADENYSYYDENYRKGDGGGVNLARQYNRSQSGTNVNFFPNYGFGSHYGGSAFYDPFYDPFYYGSAYYDPFFYRPFVRVRPGIIVNIGAGFGMGWGSYGGWHDPFYSRMYDPFYGGYGFDNWGRSYYGGYGYNSFYNPYRYGYGGGNNVIIVNPSNGNNNDRRTVRYSPRSGRGSGAVNDNFDNSPRSGRAERGGRVDQSVDGNVNPNSGRGSSNPNISSDGNRPARAVRPGSGNTQDVYTNPQRSSQDVNAGGSRTYSPNVNGDNNNRAVRPRGNSDMNDNNRSRNNTYYDNSNSNRSSAPTYSSPSPSTGRSPRSYDSNSTPRSNNWDNSNSGSRSGGSYNNNSGGSYSSPSPSSSPRGGDGGGSRSPRSSR